MQQHMIFKGFNDSKRFLDRSQYFDMLEGEKRYQLCYQYHRKSRLLMELS